MANVVGSVPDGWWRDRGGAAQQLLSRLAELSGTTVAGPQGDPIRLTRILAVLEGRANLAKDADHVETEGTLEVIRANGSGDDDIARLVTHLDEAGHRVLVVTADRGLRTRLPAAVETVGPGWLNALLGRGATGRRPSE